VRLARAVGAFAPDAEIAIELGLRAAEALEANWLLLQTPATLGPGSRNRERLKQLFERLLKSGRHVAWDPRGVWEEAEVLPLISAVDVQWARDASRYDMVEESLAYARIPALGTAARVGMGLAERAGENLRGFDEAYVVIEGEGAGRAAAVIRQIAQLPEAEADETPDDGVEELSLNVRTNRAERQSSGDPLNEVDDESFEDDGELNVDSNGESDEDVESDEDDEFVEDDESDEDAFIEDDESDEEELDDDEDDDESPKVAEDDSGKPERIDDSDLPWAPKKPKVKR
jgi:hypothetical protein